MGHIRILRFLLLACLLPTIPIYAQNTGRAHIPLPADLTGTLNGSPYRIRVPANWSGTLLVYCHGTSSGVLEVAPATYPSTSPTLEEHLLSLGYALAGSYYPDSTKDGPQRTLALTNFFQGHVGNPRRTIVWGQSLGGVNSLVLIENYPSIYDGAIAIASPDAGMAEDTDGQLRYDVAYAAAFGWPTEDWGPLEDLRDDLMGNEATLIMPVFQWANPGNYGNWEFVRLAMKLDYPTWWNIEPTTGLWGYAIEGWKAIAIRSATEKFAGGNGAENIDDFYTLTDEEKSYLSTLGVNADELLAWMNAHTSINARRSARNHLQHYGTPSGKLRRPVISMHGMFDPVAWVTHESAYRELVNASGNGDRLVQIYVNAPGHVSFSFDQLMAALKAMESWLDLGVRPDTSAFPENIGFDNSFAPPPWPY
jgi:pimeloyl-ACP methyl ester carboxylesterase